MKELIKIPVYYYENANGHKIINEKEMTNDLKKEIEKLKLETKRVKETILKKIF